MKSQQSRGTRVSELPHLGRMFRRGSRVVTIRCLRVAGPRSSRFEVTISTEGARAVIDVPGSAEAELPRRIDVAAEAFLEAIALRDDGPLG